VDLGHKLLAVTESGALVEETFARREREIADATVVLACGLVPDDSLAARLRGRIPDVRLVGDALAPRRIMHATLDGARVGADL
jgi:2-enoate reductase